MTQSGLHHRDPDRSRRWTTDERTVGDLLLEADLAVRELLWDAPPEAAKNRARSWGEVTEAAADLWAAIPDRTADPSMERIHKITLALHHTQQRAGWPGAGDGDANLERAAECLSRAAEMVSVRIHPTAPLSAAAHLDSVAARTRIMHVVYVASHAVRQPLVHYERDVRRVRAAKHRVGDGESAVQARNTLARVGAVEHLAGSYLDGRWPAGLAGQHRDPVEPQRLAQAVGQWAVQSRRTLASSPTLGDLLRTAMSERDLAISGGRVLEGAAGVGAIDAEQHAVRLRPALVELEQSWGRVVSDLTDLTGRHAQVSPDLRAAAMEMRASLREISHDLGGLATPATMAERADLYAASLEIHRGLIASVDLGHVLRDVLHDPQLSAPARGIQLVAGRLEADPGDAAWVDAGALVQNRSVALPGAVRDSLGEGIERVVRAAVLADSAGAFLGAAHRTDSPTTATGSGRGHAERRAPAPPSAPSFGCDR